MSESDFLKLAEDKAKKHKQDIDLKSISKESEKPVQQTDTARVEPVQSEGTAREKDGKSFPTIKRSGRKVRLELSVPPEIRKELRDASSKTGISISSLLVMSWQMSKHNVCE